MEGVQSHHVGTSLKHYAANNQEHMRMTCSSDMDERTLREIYLAGFETVVKKAHPYTLMCSYNKVNGEYASENKHLLTEILRDEWGFDGYVMSDWGAVNDRVKGLEAGLELEMPASGGVTDAEIVAAVKESRLDEAVLDRAVERILDVLFRYADNREDAVFDRNAHHQLSAELEKECAVLLKNEGVLPLNRSQKIAYIGGFAKTPVPGRRLLPYQQLPGIQRSGLCPGQGSCGICPGLCPRQRRDGRKAAGRGRGGRPQGRRGGDLCRSARLL